MMSMKSERQAAKAEPGRNAGTPGPWDIAFKPGERTAYIIGPGGDAVAFIIDRGILISEVEKERANATLISAAPEMYEALKTAQAILATVTQDSLYDNGKAKIAAALRVADGVERWGSARTRE